MLPIYDLAVPHIIKVLYVMMLASSYGVFLTFSYLVKNQEVGGDQELVARFKPIEIVFHTSYMILLIIGFVPEIGAECQANRTYRNIIRNVFIMCIAYLFVVNAIFCVVQSIITIYFYN